MYYISIIIPIIIGTMLSAGFISTIVWYVRKPEARSRTYLGSSKLMIISALLVFVIAGWMIVPPSLKRSYEWIYLSSHGTCTQGEIIKITGKDAVVQFKTGDMKMMQFNSSFFNAADFFTKGQQIDILYLPHTPSCAMINDFPHGLGWVLARGTILVAFFSAFILYVLLLKWENNDTTK